MTQDHSDIPLVHQRIVLISIEELLGHEEVVQPQVDWLKENLKGLNYFFRPILVVKHEKVILDGHHRVVALKELGKEWGKNVIKIPCIEIEYIDNEEISLDTWHPLYFEQISKKFPKELKKMKIHWNQLETFTPSILNNSKFGFILKTADNQYFTLEGSQQEIYGKFLEHFNPKVFDYAKTIKRALHSVDNGRSSFALLRTRVTKHDVIRAAKSGILFAPKTTRHILSFRYQDIKVPLDALMS
ncbi:MAG: ParB N-terminal domain-containing protein [Candidatus Heimdallarchaeota archaeon]|nr:MAG: ParB N-terminal domain-containing protein [Candidatus Heimdallarchaeota archaeon]